MKTLSAISVVLVGLFAFLGMALAGVADYLILEDIEPYKLFTGIPGRVFSGPPSKYSQSSTGGVLDAVGHFSENDQSYEASYREPGKKWPFVNVEITHHAGADSDKWLPHEIDFDFRNYYGIPGRSYGPRQIDGQTILEDAVGGRSYRWLSGNKVIMIQYRDSQMTKPEPLEVVRVYLAKHPSTVQPLSLVELRSTENKTKWIKDEIERRLWLCDKWFLQLQMGKAELSDVLQTVVKHLEVFLNYRERYYGPKALDDRKALFGYLETKDGTSVKNKLSEYKTWWAVNKTRSISVP